MISVFVTHGLIEFPINGANAEAVFQPGCFCLLSTIRATTQSASHANQLLALSIYAWNELKRCFTKIDCLPLAPERSLLQKCTKWLRNFSKKSCLDTIGNSFMVDYVWVGTSSVPKHCERKLWYFFDRFETSRTPRKITFPSSPAAALTCSLNKF